MSDDGTLTKSWRKAVAPVGSVFDDPTPLRRPAQAPENEVSPTQVEQVGEDEDGDAKEYRAFVAEKGGGRKPAQIRIQYGNGKKGQLAYSYLMEEVADESGQLITLFFTHVAITITGRNLDQLFNHLQDYKVRAIHCFNPLRHTAPAEDAPIIESITRQTHAELLDKSQAQQVRQEKQTAAQGRR